MYLKENGIAHLADVAYVTMVTLTVSVDVILRKQSSIAINATENVGLLLPLISVSGLIILKCFNVFLFKIKNSSDHVGCLGDGELAELKRCHKGNWFCSPKCSKVIQILSYSC